MLALLKTPLADSAAMRRSTRRLVAWFSKRFTAAMEHASVRTRTGGLGW